MTLEVRGSMSRAPREGPPGTPRQRYEAGRRLRRRLPRQAQGTWTLVTSAAADRIRPIHTGDHDRVAKLLPEKYKRMRASPFAFFRGSAALMAADLATTASTRATVQICGDAHVRNLGAYASPEGRIVFDVNDFDETCRAPWEWDVKRLATSFVVACRDNGLSNPAATDAVMTCVRSYRESMAEFSEMKTLELWYYSLGADELIADIKDPAFRRRAIKRLQKERARSVAEDIFPKLVERKGEMPFIKDQLPTIFHAEGHEPGEVQQAVRDAIAMYRDTLPHSTRSLLDRYDLRDAAIKVVGIGSVGTACWVLLFMAGEGDPLFLQVKEARASVLEAFAGASEFTNHGQRVVNGYRLMQPASDMFLGWSRGPKRDFFVRQLRDIKISIRVETFGAPEMDLYASWCGRALALSHARSGSSITLSGYMGKSDAFDRALAAFATAYADQNEKDHAALARAVKKGTVKAEFEEER
jgi:uncharacterized protein (DUF2252 family)